MHIINLYRCMLDKGTYLTGEEFKVIVYPKKRYTRVKMYWSAKKVTWIRLLYFQTWARSIESLP